MEKIQEIIAEQCNCLSDVYEVLRKFCNSSLVHCDKNSDTKQCENELRATIAMNFIEIVANHCPSLCTMNKTYPKFSSSDHWPSQLARSVVRDQIISYYCHLKANGINSTLDEVVQANFVENGSVDWLRDNFLRIAIYADFVRGNKVSESDAFPFVNFLSDWRHDGRLVWCLDALLLRANAFVNLIFLVFTFKARRPSHSHVADGDGEA